MSISLSNGWALNTETKKNITNDHIFWHKCSVKPLFSNKNYTAINSLAPGICGCKLELLIFKLLLGIDILSISHENALKCHLNDD